MRCARSSPAIEGVADELPEEKPLFVGPLSRSCTATLGTWGTGSLRWAPSGFEMMSPILRPDDALGMYGASRSVWGSMGARAGTKFWLRLKWRKCGNWRSLKPCGRRRGECAGVARGVWSGVGLAESWENVGEGGAVDMGEPGRDRFVILCA